MTDQQSASMMSCTGNPWLKTPALDNLAANGFRFTQAYCTNPVCCPSRFSLQTGLFPSAIGMRENGDRHVDTAEVKTLLGTSLGNTLKAGGYQTYYGGKVHLPVTGIPITSWGYELLTTDERDGLAAACRDFLLSRKKDASPFLLVASFINPHDICYDAIRWAEPESNLARHTPADLDPALSLPQGVSRQEFFRVYCPPLPSNHMPMIGVPDAEDSLISLRPFRKIVRQQWTEEDWRLHSWAYMRLTERADSLIGIVLAALKKSGLAENTVVIFTSDHGDNNGSHKLEHKTVFYEEASNIPLIISTPRMRRRGHVDSIHLVSNGLDLLPTLCDLAGIEPPPGLAGRSLKPLIDGDYSGSWRKYLFLENQIGDMVRTTRYKYEKDLMGKQREMFVDLRRDPGETRNLVSDPSYNLVVDSLRSVLTAHLVGLRSK
ncbi:choline-sulfatase [Compostibacter hankyongensis]|uniref:Choline-sulfatase n=2 Tax=Compostibacter hankyongensis TaxID=1007089 RepID=A0ABP8FBF0_9BACT